MSPFTARPGSKPSSLNAVIALWIMCHPRHTCPDRARTGIQNLPALSVRDASGGRTMSAERNRRGSFLPGPVIPVTLKLVLQGLPCQAPGVIGVSAGTGWPGVCIDSKFDVPLLPQCGSAYNRLSRSSRLLGR